MQVNTRQDHGQSGRTNLRDRLEYRLILALCFFLYFFVVLFQRLFHALLGQSDRANEKHETVFAETSAAARIAAGYSFMS